MKQTPKFVVLFLILKLNAAMAGSFREVTREFLLEASHKL